MFKGVLGASATHNKSQLRAKTHFYHQIPTGLTSFGCQSLDAQHRKGCSRGRYCACAIYVNRVQTRRESPPPHMSSPYWMWRSCITCTHTYATEQTSEVLFSHKFMRAFVCLRTSHPGNVTVSNSFSGKYLNSQLHCNISSHYQVMRHFHIAVLIGT